MLNPALIGTGEAATDINITISTNTQAVDCLAQIISAGWNELGVVNATITIDSGVYVGAASHGSPAMQTGGFDTSHPGQVNLTIDNNGFIYGAGGAGGAGASCNCNMGTGCVGCNCGSGGSGSAGSNAFTADDAVTVDNTGGVIAGGGAGINGSASPRMQTLDIEGTCEWCEGDGGDGGDGGRGYPGGAGGAGGAKCGGGGGPPPATDGAAGTAGTLSTGGGLGSGSATEGDSNITWTALGTITGARNG